MPYDMQIDRANPGCIVFLVDLSNSMLDGIAGTPRRAIESFDCAPVRALMSSQTSTYGLIGQRVDPIRALAEKGLGSLGWIELCRGSHFEILQLEGKADRPSCQVFGFSG